jgi:hypothetical protein
MTETKTSKMTETKATSKSGPGSVPRRRSAHACARVACCGTTTDRAARPAACACGLVYCSDFCRTSDQDHQSSPDHKSTVLCKCPPRSRVSSYLYEERDASPQCLICEQRVCRLCTDSDDHLSRHPDGAVRILKACSGGRSAEAFQEAVFVLAEVLVLFVCARLYSAICLAISGSQKHMDVLEPLWRHILQNAQGSDAEVTLGLRCRFLDDLSVSGVV